jgi:rare lipoprotein A
MTGDLMRAFIATAVLCLAALACLTYAARSEPIYCYASYYWQGQKTANGESFKPDGKTCAHKTIQFHTKVKVTNLRNGKSTVCRVNDRGPYVAKRCVDLSRGAARDIGMLVAGVVPVSIEIVGCAPRLTGAALAGC